MAPRESRVPSNDPPAPLSANAATRLINQIKSAVQPYLPPKSTATKAPAPTAAPPAAAIVTAAPGVQADFLLAAAKNGLPLVAKVPAPLVEKAPATLNAKSQALV